MTSLKQLLSSIVDYAGLFPPAQLSLSEAMTVYGQAQSSPHHWMLDRFVVPATRLSDLVKLPIVQETHRFNHGSLSVILSQDWAAELEQIHQIIAAALQHNRILISSLEVAPLPPAEIQWVCHHLPAEANVFFEIPFDAELEPYLKVLQQTGTAAKLRTGGITTDAFPTSKQLSQRILAFADAQIPFKATAGLHHPLRSTHALTHTPNSDLITMHGFLNVAILAAFANQQSITSDEAWSILEESSAAHFQFTETFIRWHGRLLSIPEIERSRQQFFRSFGSCSFQDPIDDLHSLGLL